MTFCRTVFFGGDTFAPKLKVGDKTAQAFLQDAFLNCWEVICQYTSDLEAVLGYQVCCISSTCIGLTDLLSCRASMNHTMDISTFHLCTGSTTIPVSTLARSVCPLPSHQASSLTRVYSFCPPVLGPRRRAPDLRPVLPPLLPRAYQVGRKSPRQQGRCLGMAS